MSKQPTPESKINLFLDDEKHACDQLIAQLQHEVSNVYCLRIHNIDQAGEAVEAIIAAFLLTNAVLMSRTPRKIRKFITFGTKDPGLLYANANHLRALLHGTFTSLGQVNTWKKVITDRWEIAENITNVVADAVSFFEVSGISSGAADYHRAEIFIGVEGNKTSDANGGQFFLDDTDAFAPTISGLKGSYRVVVGDFFRREGLQLNTGLKGRNVIVDIDCAHLDEAMANWLENLHHVLELDFYRVGSS